MNEFQVNRSVWNQCIIVFQKNWLIYKRDKTALIDFSSIAFGITYQYSAQFTLNNDSTIKLIAALLSPFSYMMLTTMSVVTSMIKEKSDQQKETQKIMGLKSVSYSLGWMMSNYLRLFFLIFIFSVSMIPTSMMEYGQDNDNFLKTEYKITGFILYSLAQLQIYYIIASIYEVPLLGASRALSINFCGFLTSLLLMNKYVQKNTYVVYIACLQPSFCYNVQPFVSMVGLKNFDFQLMSWFLMLIFDIIFYGLLALYLDQVVPNQYGINKHPLFFLGVKNKKRKQNQQSNSIIQPLNEEFQKCDEDLSSAIFHENVRQQLKRAIEINELNKNFGETKAVNNLTVQIYESQILCLLGHNGAGKTTVISLLTGLITKDQGQIKYYGKDIENEIGEIRSFLGICSQKDVLYDQMTVLEHLEYYGKIKGMNGDELQQQISEIVEKCALEQEVTKLAKQLSGGNKRKLSLAMALIGGSKVLFLDEPTSGIDPVTRRKIWDILLQMKNEGRCLILTTHHLDEAEILSERIAIMAQGKLLTVGSVDYIKKNFGIGYHLNIYNLTNDQNIWEDKQEKIKSLVINQIQESQLEPYKANECVRFSIPFNCKNKLLTIFDRLENDNTIQINLMMNTLEEAFVNIGIDEEAFFKKAQNGNFVEQQVKINLNDEFAKIIPPACLQNDPIYSFNLQFKACFLRQLYGMKGKRLILLLLSLSIQNFLVPLIASLAKSHYNLDENQEDKNNYYQQMYKILDSQQYWYSFCVNIFTFVLIVMEIIFLQILIGDFLIKERQLKLKYSLCRMGCRIWPYWISNFVFDALLASIFIFGYSLIILIFQIESLNNFVVYVLFFFTILSNITLSYLLSWLFLNFLQAMKFLMIMVFIFLIFGILLFILIKSQVVKWMFSFLIPQVSLLAGMIANLNQHYILNDKMDIQVVFVENSWIFVFILIFQTILYFFLAVAIDYRKQQAVNSLANTDESTDNDVIQEAKRVQNNNFLDQVQAKQISKTYANGFQALKGTSFGVDSGSILGLLGPNGSGKSTTFNLITCGLKPTTGIIKLMGQEIEKGKGEIFQNVGICPQTDCLFQLLTVKHHLQIWALLKGLDGQDVLDAVQYFLKVMQLEEYKNTISENLSGGNKRKLCVALALMGGTNILFFDEPSSGLDPIARRFLWNAIQNGIRLRNGAAILTTHNMDEAESLCQKIAIQINGQLSYFGTPQHLKQKFGQGYRVSLELEDGVQSKSVIVVIKKEYPDCQIQEENNYQIVVQLSNRISHSIKHLISFQVCQKIQIDQLKIFNQLKQHQNQYFSIQQVNNNKQKLKNKNKRNVFLHVVEMMKNIDKKYFFQINKNIFLFQIILILMI